MAARAPLRLLLVLVASSKACGLAQQSQLAGAEVGGGALYRPDTDDYGDAGSRSSVPSAVVLSGRLGREGARRAVAQSWCREEDYLELRAMCERNLDEVMRLYTKGERGQSCQRLHQYTACVGKALNRTRCHRVAELTVRERQRMRANVNDYNWSCSISSRQEYAAGGFMSASCDGKALINHHMKCGSTFQNFVGSINVYKEQTKACRAVRDYKDCVKPIFQNDECQGNQELMDRLLRFSHTVLKEYSSSCKERRTSGGDYQGYHDVKKTSQCQALYDVQKSGTKSLKAAIRYSQDAPGAGYSEEDDGVGSGFCRFEQLRQKTLQCQREGYSIIRTRDAHAKADICEELKVFKDCAVAALKATHCSKEKGARQYVVGAVRESFARFGIQCTGLWNSAAPGAASRWLALVLTALLLGMASLQWNY